MFSTHRDALGLRAGRWFTPCTLGTSERGYSEVFAEGLAQLASARYPGAVKTSMFNVCSDLVEGRVLVFNTLTLSLASLDQREMAALLHAQDPDGQFLALGFVVPDDIDERQRVRTVFAEAKAREDALSVFLVLTLACNFDCSYCSNAVGHRFGSPGRVAQEALAFVDANLRTGQTLFCTFYGGEPLLTLSEVERSAAQITALCADRGSPVVFDLLSNGYLLDEAALDRLATCGVDGLQLSFDLPFAMSRRGNGRESPREVFKRVVSVAASATNQICYTLRFNVRRGFLGDLRSVVDEVKRSGLQCSIALHHIFPGPNMAATTFDSPQEVDAYYHEYRNARRLLIESGLSKPVLPEESSEPCSAASGRGFFVVESGVRTCIREVTGPGASVDRGVPNDIARHYQNYDGGGDEECARCAFLPVCNGGCPKDVRDGMKIPLRCSPWRFTLKSELNHLVKGSQRRDGDASDSATEYSTI